MRASLPDFQGRALQAEHSPEVGAWWYIQEQQDSEGGRSGRELEISLERPYKLLERL